MGTYGKVMENFHKGPDVTEATKLGEPTLVDPKQASAPEMVRSANESVKTTLEGAGMGNHVSIEQVKTGTPLPADTPAPHSDAAAGAPDAATAAAGTTGAASTGDQPAGTEVKNDLPVAGDASAAPLPAPTQVNDLANSGSSSSGTAAASTNGAAASSSSTQAPPANTDTESSSKKKKKKHLLVF